MVTKKAQKVPPSRTMAQVWTYALKLDALRPSGFALVLVERRAGRQRTARLCCYAKLPTALVEGRHLAQLAGVEFRGRP